MPSWRVPLLSLLILGCGREPASEPPAPTITCPAGYDPRGEQCVAHLDECGDSAIPKLGGGCTPVGIPKDGCGTGFVSDGRGGCDAMLPPPCARGTIAVPGDASCTSVGIAICSSGFSSDGKGGCEVVLPKDRCPTGTVALPGETACREIAPCGSDVFGDPPAGSSKFDFYVDASYGGTTPSDGSRDRPFTTIGAALTAASSTGDTTIGIAAGTYTENLVLTKRVHLWGRCPAMVKLETIAATAVIDAQKPSSVHRVSMTGSNSAVHVGGEGNTIEVDRCIMHDLSIFGVHVQDSAVASVRGSLVERATIAGMVVTGAQLDIEGTVVRDTRARSSDGFAGRGISAEISPSGSSKLSIKQSILERNVETALTAFGATVVIEGSVMRETLPGATVDKSLGRAINAYSTTLTVRDSLIDHNYDAGAALFGGDALFERCVIRDTQPNAGSSDFGFGVVGLLDGTKQANVTIRASVLERNRTSGLYLDSSRATVETSILRDQRLRATDNLLGTGVTLDSSRKLAELTVRRSLLDSNYFAGILAGGAAVKVEQSVVRAARAAAPTIVGAAGLVALPSPSGKVGSTVSVSGSLVERNEGGGIVAYGAVISLESSLVRDTLPYPSTGAQGNGISVVRDEKTDFPTSLVLKRSVVERNFTFGVLLMGVPAEIDATVIRGTKAQLSDATAGVGVAAMYADDGTEADLTLRSSLVERNFEVNVSVVGSSAHVSGSILRDALVSAAGKYGDGLFVWSQPRPGGKLLLGSAEVDGSLFSKNPRVGLAAFGAKLALRTSVARCNGFDLDYELLETDDGNVAPKLEDAGGNWCGCTTGLDVCRSGSAGLAPIPLPPRLKAP